MTVLLVIGSLLTLLAVACWWEARSGRPAWGEHLGTGAPTARSASTAAKTGVAAALGTAAATGFDVGGDG